MSYMRGNHYLWRDETHLHVWVLDGYDGWDEAGWMPTEDHQASGHVSETQSRPGGVGIQQPVIDEYVVMRFAELVRDGLLQATVDRALSGHSGNGGCGALQQYAPTIRHVGVDH